MKELVSEDTFEPGNNTEQWVPGFRNAQEGIAKGSVVRGRNTLQQRNHDAEFRAAMRAAHGRLCLRCAHCGRCRPKKMRTPTAEELAAIQSSFSGFAHENGYENTK